MDFDHVCFPVINQTSSAFVTPEKVSKSAVINIGGVKSMEMELNPSVEQATDMVDNGEFLALMKTKSENRSYPLEQAQVTLKVSKFVNINTCFKAVVSMLFLDDKGKGYWCYKAYVMGLVYATVNDFLKLGCPELNTYQTYYKKSNDISGEIEMYCPDKK